MTVEKGLLAWDGGTVSAVWHHPERGMSYLLLGHGAGGTMHTPGLAKFAAALAAGGVGAVRFNFPYTEAKRKGPDPQPRLEACYRAVAEQVGQRAGKLFLGGRSMGGRIASHIVADGFPAAGLVFLSYPLHPPARPDRLRSAHLARINIPMLFLQGSRDAFAQPELLANTITALKMATLHTIEGADHGLRVRGRTEEEVIAELVAVTLNWMQRLE